VLLILPVVFAFFALGLDAGVWFFDHRTAQNQADAAALAAVQHLPAANASPNTDLAFPSTAAAHTWLGKNGWDTLKQVPCGPTGAL
jgi:uncharacterized membrane protein